MEIGRVGGRIGTHPRLTFKGEEEKTQQKTSRLVQPALTNEKPELREVDLEPSAKRGTRALVSLY